MKMPLISVCMITYNHEAYIRDAVDGVLMQKTSFPIELIIGEDCSTDNTRFVVEEYAKKYPEIIVAQYPETNRGMMKNFQRVLQSARGKYVALCEGDDYWTDPLKLQKQVNFLEENSDYGLIYTKARVFYQDQMKFGVEFGGIGVSFMDILCYNPIPTLTTCFRKEIIDLYFTEIIPFSSEWKMGDYSLWLFLSQNSKVKYLNSVSGVYRVLHNSASHNNDIDKQLNYYASGFKIANFFIDKYMPMNSALKLHFLIESLWFQFRLFCIENRIDRFPELNTQLFQLQKFCSLKVFVMKNTISFPLLRYLLQFHFHYSSKK